MPRAEQWVIPPTDFIQIAPGEVTVDTDLPENCRGLLIGTAGSLNVTMANEQERDSVPFLQGITPGFFATIRISGGGAQNVWAIV